MSDDDAFLQAVRTAPRDDLPRLVYADYLDERGDPRGEFIRLECQQEALTPDDPRWDEFISTERELLDKYAGQWTAPLFDAVLARGLKVDNWTGNIPAPLAWRAWFRRGFIEEVATPAALYLANADALWDHAPLRCLSMIQASDHIAELRADARLKELDTLRLYGDYLRDPDCRRLREAAEACGMRVLAFNGADADWDYVASRPPIPPAILYRWSKLGRYQFYPVDRPAIADEKLRYVFGPRINDVQPWAWVESDYNFSDDGSNWRLLALFGDEQAEAFERAREVPGCGGEAG